jgi:hypothetical protein
MAREFNPQMGDLAQIQVYGVPEMLALLKTVDPELRKATIARMKLAAEPILQEARSLIPDQPISVSEKPVNAAEAGRFRDVSDTTLKRFDVL